MSSDDNDIGIDETDIDHLPPKVLRMMIRRLRAKRLKDRDPEDVSKDEAAAEEERIKASEEAEKQRGSSPKIPVEEDDLPFEVCDDEECEDPSEVEEEEEKTPPKKGAKK